MLNLILVFKICFVALEFNPSVHERCFSHDETIVSSYSSFFDPVIERCRITFSGNKYNMSNIKILMYQTSLYILC